MKGLSIVFAALISLCVLFIVEGHLPNQHNHRWCPNGGPVLDHHGRKVKCNSTRPCPNGYSCWDQACCPTIEVTTTELPVTFLNCNDDTVPIGVDCTFYDTCVELGCLDGLYCLTQNISIGNTYLLDGSCVQNPCWNSMPLVNEHQITSLCNLDSPGTLECPDQYTCTPVQDDVEGRSVCCPWEPTTVTTTEDPTYDCNGNINFWFRMTCWFTKASSTSTTTDSSSV